MRIAIIGAGIAGLAAGRKLAQAGHEINVIEKSRGLGGRLATRYAGNNNEIKLDHGTSFFTADKPEFMAFVAELLDKNLVSIWGKNMWQYDGEQILKARPNLTEKIKYVAKGGMNSIGKYMARWVDVQTNTKVGGLTYFGVNRSKKKPWMVNLTNYNTFEADAVIIATPAPQAYGVLLTCQDEIDTFKIIREIDEVEYDPSFAMMAGYSNSDIPEWDLITCNDEVIKTISNENSKGRGLENIAVVVHSTAVFAKINEEADRNEIADKMIENLTAIIGGWSSSPDWKQLHFWRYASVRNPIQKLFMELETLDAPLALVGDYFDGGTVEDAYCSGLKLAEHWIDKFGD